MLASVAVSIYIATAAAAADVGCHEGPLHMPGDTLPLMLTGFAVRCYVVCWSSLTSSSVPSKWERVFHKASCRRARTRLLLHFSTLIFIVLGWLIISTFDAVL